MSDLHTDHTANLAWCHSLADQAGVFKRDVLIVAGDITARHPLLKETLQTLKKAFLHVFYTPGRQAVRSDWWVLSSGQCGD